MPGLTRHPVKLEVILLILMSPDPSIKPFRPDLQSVFQALRDGHILNIHFLSRVPVRNRAKKIFWNDFNMSYHDNT